MPPLHLDGLEPEGPPADPSLQGRIYLERFNVSLNPRGPGPGLQLNSVRRHTERIDAQHRSLHVDIGVEAVGQHLCGRSCDRVRMVPSIICRTRCDQDRQQEASGRNNGGNSNQLQVGKSTLAVSVDPLSSPFRKTGAVLDRENMHT
jgi:hypothetical protein